MNAVNKTFSFHREQRQQSEQHASKRSARAETSTLYSNIVYTGVRESDTH